MDFCAKLETFRTECGLITKLFFRNKRFSYKAMNCAPPHIAVVPCSCDLARSDSAEKDQ